MTHGLYFRISTFNDLLSISVNNRFLRLYGLTSNLPWETISECRIRATRSRGGWIHHRGLRSHDCVKCAFRRISDNGEKMPDISPSPANAAIRRENARNLADSGPTPAIRRGNARHLADSGRASALRRDISANFADSGGILR